MCCRLRNYLDALRCASSSWSSCSTFYVSVTVVTQQTASVHFTVCTVLTLCSNINNPFLLLTFSFTIASHYWDADTGENDCFSGKGHSNQVSKAVVNDADELVTCSMDDTLRFTNINKKEYRWGSSCAAVQITTVR